MATPPPAPAAAPIVARAGTLQYTRGNLLAIFAWLLGAEVVFVLIDIIEPQVLPVLLKFHGATDTQIAIIIGSVNAVLQLLIMPPLGYWSDRLRTRWGRRIPVLFWVTPFVTLFLTLTPFSPEIAAWLSAVPVVKDWLPLLPITPVILVFAALVILYRTVQTATNVCFFGLLRDVVPDTHMGRFLALFRVFGAAGTAIVSYWLLGLTETHSKHIFIGIAVLNLLCFTLLCRFVREGEYPPVAPSAAGAGAGRAARLWAATKTFVRESYRHPVYLWFYFVRVCLYGALLGLSHFTIFFPQHELGMSLMTIGAYRTYPLLVWIVIAFPVGWLVDRRGAVEVLKWGLVMITLGYVLTFLLATGPLTFLAGNMIFGVAFWVVMMAQLKLTAEVFHPQRYSQLAGANTIVQSILIAAVISPVCGWILDALKGWSHPLTLPGAGEVVIGPYRLVYLMMGACYLFALFGLNRVGHHMRKLGGPGNYQAPL
ncbi:MAG: MFS transporter [Verrucomicrobiota bacterium]